jgi:hypothetical protein
MAGFTLSQLDAKPADYTVTSTDLVVLTVGTATPFLSSVKLSIQQLDEALSLTTGDWVKNAAGDLYYTGGHVSIGTSTIQNWATGYTALQLGGNSVIAMADNDQVDTSLNLGQNWYYDGAWKYNDSDSASRMTFDDGTVKLRVAQAGVADSAITWIDAIAVDSAGRVSIGSATPEHALSVAGGISAQGGLSATGITSFDTGDVKIGDDLTISTTNNANITNTPFIRSNGSDLRINSRNSSISGALYLNHDSPGNVIMATGWGGTNVGIGTTAPAEALTVAGNVSASPTSYYKGAHHGFQVKNYGNWAMAGGSTTKMENLSTVRYNGPYGGGDGAYGGPGAAAGLADHWQTEYQRFFAPVNGWYHFSSYTLHDDVELDKSHATYLRYVSSWDEVERNLAIAVGMNDEGDHSDHYLNTSGTVWLSAGSLAYASVYNGGVNARNITDVVFSGHLVSAD